LYWAIKFVTLARSFLLRFKFVTEAIMKMAAFCDITGRIFGPKRDDVMEEYRKLLNEELYNLYSSPDIIKSRRMKWAGHVARMGDVLVEKSERKKETTQIKA
jgi:hypothetical protein